MTEDAAAVTGAFDLKPGEFEFIGWDIIRDKEGRDILRWKFKPEGHMAIFQRIEGADPVKVAMMLDVLRLASIRSGSALINHDEIGERLKQLALSEADVPQDGSDRDVEIPLTDYARGGRITVTMGVRKALKEAGP